MLEADIRRLILESPLAHAVDQIMPYSRPAVRMRSYLVEDADELPIGASRIGGVPDLPPGLRWPVYKGRESEFLFQIDFAKAAEAYALPTMPDSGMLFVFRNYDPAVGEDHTDDPNQCYVGFFENDLSSLVRTPCPHEGTRVFNTCEIVFEREDCLPDLWELETAGLFGDEARDVTLEFNNRLNDAVDMPVHRIGGYPMLIQSFLEGLNLDDFHFQIDTDEEVGWGCGDEGRLYFRLPRADMEARRFGAMVRDIEYY